MATATAAATATIPCAYGAAAVGAAAYRAAVAAPHCWINSYGYRVCNYVFRPKAMRLPTRPCGRSPFASSITSP
jgi:hypothetical protein